MKVIKTQQWVVKLC